MSRCKCCDIKLPRVMERKTKFGVIIEDLCTRCRNSSFELYSYTADHEYQFEGLREGVADAVPSAYDSDDS